jgi:hypothetical protein
MVPRKVRICPSESTHRCVVAWRIETESKRDRVENGRYLLVDGRWRSRNGDGLHRYLRFEANAQQILCEGAGVISPLGVGTLQESDARRCLRCEDDTRHVPRRGAGVVDSLWPYSRRGAASCLATVAPSPPPTTRRIAGQTRVFLFRRGRKSSSSSPSPSEPTTIVVVMLRGEEYHVVAAFKGHELETPKAEHHPGLKRLLKATHLELNGKVLSTRNEPLPGAPTVGVLDPGDPQPDRLVNLLLRVPAQMG